jgi:hypothetical protein
LADASADGVHRKTLARDVLARDAALLTETVREAGALALSLFGTELKNWTKGASSPVSEADIAVNDLIAEGCDPRRRTMAGCRRRAPTTKSVSAGSWSGLSIRSTAPAVISPAAKIGA